MGFTEGSKFPDVTLDYGFPPTPVNMTERLKGKKTIVVGLPGAFTPTWSTCQVPGYLGGQDRLKAAGIDEVLVFCVNDGAVMDAWAKSQKIEGSNLTFLADTRAELTKALDIVLDHAGVMQVLGNPRCKRCAYYVEDGTVKLINISEGPNDPAGDSDPSKSCIDYMLERIDNEC